MTPMSVAELQEDTDEPTQPCTPSGIRLRQMHTEEGSMIRNGRNICRALKSRRAAWAQAQHDRLECVVASIESWSLGEPNAETRDRIVDEYELLVDAIFNQAVGNR